MRKLSGEEIAEFVAGKHGIPHKTVRKIIADQQEYTDVAKLAILGTVKCLRTTDDSVVVKMKKLLTCISA